MESVSISEAKNKLSALLDKVKAGETIVITDRGRPIARLEPAASQGDDVDGRLARLERAGLIRRGRGPIPLDLIRQPPPKPKNGASVLEALLEERREGR